MHQHLLLCVLHRVVHRRGINTFALGGVYSLATVTAGVGLDSLKEFAQVGSISPLTLERSMYRCRCSYMSFRADSQVLPLLQRIAEFSCTSRNTFMDCESRSAFGVRVIVWTCELLIRTGRSERPDTGDAYVSPSTVSDTHTHTDERTLCRTNERQYEWTVPDSSRKTGATRNITVVRS